MSKIKEARNAAGLSIKQLSDMLNIPYRTLQNWEGGIREPAPWAEKLIIEKIEENSSCAKSLEKDLDLTEDAHISAGIPPDSQTLGRDFPLTENAQVSASISPDSQTLDKNSPLAENTHVSAGISPGGQSMESDYILTIQDIKTIVSVYAKKYGADRIYLFGSYARGEAGTSSDIDLRIDKGKIRGLGMGVLLADLEDALGKNVDLISTKSMQKEFLLAIKDEEILLYKNS